METLIRSSPVGDLQLIVNEEAVTEIRFLNGGQPPATPSQPRRPNSLLAELSCQLDAYFERELKTFDLPLAPAGTPFQQSVWGALQAIPYGQTLSYGELAAMIGRPSASRAVGAANGRNPIPIIIPCHRVIGCRGDLTGYGGGLAIKTRLLELEGWTRPRQLALT